MASVWYVVPAYNEAKVIEASISKLNGHVVVVDDCSADDTGDIARSAGAHVCRHPINLGQGAALQTGIDYALAHGADIIVTFDADGQHRAVDAEAMIAALEEHQVDIVLASRFIGKTEGMPALRRFVLKAATLYTKLTTGLALTDTHNGLRVMTARAAKSIRLRQSRMAHASEILEQIAQQGLKYREFPVTIIYTDYSRAKGQRLTGAFAVLSDLYIRRLYR